MLNGVPSPKYDLALLGRFELTGPKGVINLASGKLAGLLAYLACTAPRPQSREKLSTLLWGSHFDAKAKQNLRQALSRLRRTLGQDAIQSDGEFVWLNAASVECDVSRLEALIHEGSREALSEAIDLYRGRLIDDDAVGEEGWNDWLARERERLLELALGALVRLGEQELAAGRTEQALKAGRRAVTLDNMREDAHRQVMQALVATGRKAEALKHYQDLVALFKRELNAEPDAATRSLAAELRTTEPPGGSAAVTIAKSASVGNEAPSPGSSSERRQLTIMACSMVNAIAFSARLDPEDMRELIATFHKAVADAASRFDGFVAQYLNDGVRIYFGYPVVREHDTEQAVRAGLAICEEIARLRVASGATLQARVAIATGLVVVGEQLGTGDTRQRVAIGVTPDLAAQLEASASPGEVMIAASTYRLVGRMFDCRALAAIEVKGLPQPVEVWQVRGETAGVSRFEARRSGALFPMVGRQEEIDLLLRRWDQAKQGEGRVVLLSGEPGIGKSRIAEGLLVRLESEPQGRLRYFCSPHHTNSPLSPFIAQFERAVSFEPGSSAGAKLDKLEALLKATSRNLPQDLALIADLLSVPMDGRYLALTASPQQKREMTLTALLDQLDGAAAQNPVLIVFEDAHWIDPTSQDLLDRMVARVASLPVLLVVTVRPELQPTWADQPHVSMLPLSRLGRRDSAGIIAGITKDKALPDAVFEQVLVRADGVPLFIEELTATLLESGLLRETPDRYVLDGPMPPLAIPTTLQASLVARLDRLNLVKDVAQIGAAIGREFSYELIAAVSALDPMHLNTALERLMASGLVSRRGAPPDATFSFKHALVQDAAYATLLKSQRRHLHASIANALVERFSALAEGLPEVVAHHFAEAGLASEAIGYWVKAGRLAYARSANLEAVKSFEQALHLLEVLPESQSTLEQGCDLRLELRAALGLLGEARRVFECLREARALAERLNDDRRCGRVYALMTYNQSIRGELDEALVTGSRALEIAGRLGDLRLRVLTTSYLVYAHYVRGEHDRAIDLAAGNLAALPADWVYETLGLSAPPSVWDRTWLTICLAELGRFAEAANYEAEAIRLAEPTQQAYTKCLAHFGAGMLHLLKGDWAQARLPIEHWIAEARAGNFLNHPWGAATSAWALAQLGEVSEALNRLRQGEQLLAREAERGMLVQRVWGYHALGRASLRLNRLDAAQRLGDRGVESSEGYPGFAAHALHLLGDIATHSDRFDAQSGEANYRKALALAKSCGMRLLVAHCHLGLGTLYRRISKGKQADEHLTIATVMYREMGLTRWLEQTEAMMRQA